MQQKQRMSVDIHRLLQTVVEKGASDLHITALCPPAIRIDGKIYKLKLSPLTPAETQEIAYSLLSENSARRSRPTTKWTFLSSGRTRGVSEPTSSVRRGQWPA